MAWVAASIAVFIVGYTFLTLHFRKANRPYEPYHDFKTRAQTHTLVKAGYQRIVIPADLPADLATPAAPLPAPATIQPAPAGVPGSLPELLFDQPQLPESYRHVRASSRANRLLPYTITFDCIQGDNHQQLGGASIYIRDQTIVILPEYEKLDGQLLARRRDNLVRLTIPPDSLKPGRYKVQLAGRQESLAWSLQVH
jgi:hypothetical protein